MKNINNLKKGMSVIYRADNNEFKVIGIRRKKETVLICKDGFPETQREAKIAHIYPATEHVKEISKFVISNQYRATTFIPPKVSINNELMKKEFLSHWITMCEAEGDKKALETAKTKFNLFIEALINSLEMLDGLEVLGIRLLVPMVIDLDEDET